MGHGHKARSPSREEKKAGSPAAATATAVATLGVDTHDLGTAGTSPNGNKFGAEGGTRVPLVPHPLGPANRADGVGGTPEAVPVLTLRGCLAALQPLAWVDDLTLLVLPRRALRVADTVLARPNPLGRILVVLDPNIVTEAISARRSGREQGAGLRSQTRGGRQSDTDQAACSSQSENPTSDVTTVRHYCHFLWSLPDQISSRPRDGATVTFFEKRLLKRGVVTSA